MKGSDCGATDIRYIWSAEMDIRGSNGWTREGLIELLGWVSSGRLKPVIDRKVPLAEGIEAHRAMEERKFLGKIVITP